MNIGFIPARGGSKGLPRKNVRLFLGEPLVSRAVRIAQESKCFDKIVVNTDDKEICRLAEFAGADVVFRPPEMGSDSAEVDPLIIWTLEKLQLQKQNHLIALLYCTAPLRSCLDIQGTIDLLSGEQFDSALTLVESSDYLWSRESGGFCPTNYDPKNRAARQEEAWNQFKENKAVYTFWSRDLVSSGCRLNGRIGAYLMPAIRSVDVDTYEDFEMAETLAPMAMGAKL